MLPANTPYIGNGRHHYSMLITQMQRPDFQWNPWAVKADQAFCENPHSCVVGSGGSSKSFTAGDYAFKFWQGAPHETAVVVISTSIDAARKRIWKSIAQAYMEVSRRTGGFGKSELLSSPKPCIRAVPGDFVHGIYVVPVETGDIEQAVAAIKGYHARRILMVRDEADSISMAAVDVESNLRIGTEEFQTIDLGNLPSVLNPLGQQMAVEPGRPITEALGTEWISAKGLKCLRFDGENSPNITDNGKWTGLMTEADRAAIERQAGGRNTRTYYVMVRGLSPPEGVDDTVMSEALLHAHGTFLPVIWKRDFTLSGSLDPGFGGDKCCFRTFKRGVDDGNVFRAACDEVIDIPITTGDPTNPPEYQIAAKVKSMCAARGIAPDEFIAGTTGIGSGVAATLQREWSPSINICEEGGSPSDLPVSEEDQRPASELYDRRVTELWFSIREYVQSGTLRNLDMTTALQLCSRKWEIKNKKKSIQKKDELPSSPNEADSLCFYINLLRLKGITASVQSQAKDKHSDALQREVIAQDFDSQDTYEDEYAFEF